MTQLGIIGSGAIGVAPARLAVNARIEVTIANSRGPETLADLTDELGPSPTPEPWMRPPGTEISPSWQCRSSRTGTSRSAH